MKRHGYTEKASQQLDGRRLETLPTSESKEPTPYAVKCPDHGRVFMTDDEYTRQTLIPDALWVCPRCGQAGQFDDSNFEEGTVAHPVDRAWEAVIEALFELDSEDRAACADTLRGYVSSLPAMFEEWDKEAAGKEDPSGEV